MDLVGATYQKARTMSEIEKAKAAKRDNDLADGRLMPAEDVRMAVAEAVAVIRNRLESMPDNLAAQFAAESDEAKIRAVFYDNNEALLGELHRQIQKLARPGP